MLIVVILLLIIRLYKMKVWAYKTLQLCLGFIMMYLRLVCVWKRSRWYEQSWCIVHPEPISQPNLVHYMGVPSKYRDGHSWLVSLSVVIDGVPGTDSQVRRASSASWVFLVTQFKETQLVTYVQQRSLFKIIYSFKSYPEKKLVEITPR